MARRQRRQRPTASQRPRPAPAATPRPRPTAPAQAPVVAVAADEHLEQSYAYVRHDVIRVAILALIGFGIIIASSFVL
jgi:hypothetical protein